MNPIKRRFYFDSEGHIFFELNLYSETTVEKDIADFKALSERNRETFDVLELPFGAYQQDFAESVGYRVNVETKELEFQYRDENESGVEQPYQAPLSVEVQTAKNDAEMALLALTDVYEKQITDNALREEDGITSMIGLTEAYEMIMMRNDIITQMEERLATLEGVE